MIEMKNALGVEGTEISEHSSISRAKKIIQGPTSFQRHPTLDHRSNLAVSAAIGTDLTLLRGKMYRVIATGNCNIALYDSGANVPVVATTSDPYLPQNTPIVILTSEWDTIASVGTGTIQAAEIL